MALLPSFFETWRSSRVRVAGISLAVAQISSLALAFHKARFREQ
jgi:hypothetical protein